MTKIIGIDLGTTYSAIAQLDDLGNPEVLSSIDSNRKITASAVYIKDNSVIVGDKSLEGLKTSPFNVVTETKRQMENDVVYSLSKGKWIDNEEDNKENYTPSQISSFILSKLKGYSTDIKKVVITVPALFAEKARVATLDAAKMAGLEVIELINEPTAAACYYASLPSVDKVTGKVLVFDLGGGTFDVSVLEVGDGVFEVLSTSGDTQLGGDDFDDKIVNWLITEFKNEHNIDLNGDRQALQRLTEASEKAKVELSNLTQTDISLPFLTATDTGPKHLDRSITRNKFEELCSSLIDRARIPVENALKDAKLDKSKIDEVVLVGGSTRIPAIQDVVTKVLGKKPNQTVNPDEVVAVGAAVQAGVLAGEVKDILLLDVTPLSLGVETLGGITTRIIPRNTTIPTKKSEVFSTAVDNQPNVEIHVLQGEREFAKDNKSLGTFRLDGILPAPRGVPQIEVTFDIDANGILSVNAKDKGTGKEQSITITGASTLPSDEVERMVKESEQNASEDKKRRDKIDLRNQSDSLCYQSEKQLKELGDKVEKEDKAKIEDLIKQLRDAVQSDEAEAMKDLSTKLQNELMEIGKKIYGQDTATNEKKTDNNTGESVIDADFSETK